MRLPEDTELKKQLKVYIDAGNIEPARSLIGDDFLFAKNRNETQRLCIDYHAIKNITQKDKYPIHRTDEMFCMLIFYQYVA